MLMNIYANGGDKVVYTQINSGYDHEAKRAAELLKRGEVYTVHSTDVHSESSGVILKEFPDEVFNTVFFEDFDTVKICGCGGVMVRTKPLHTGLWECSKCTREVVIPYNVAGDIGKWMADNERNRQS